MTTLVRQLAVVALVLGCAGTAAAQELRLRQLTKDDDAPAPRVDGPTFAIARTRGEVRAFFLGRSTDARLAERVGAWLGKARVDFENEMVLFVAGSFDPRGSKGSVIHEVRLTEDELLVSLKESSDPSTWHAVAVATQADRPTVVSREGAAVFVRPGTNPEPDDLKLLTRHARRVVVARVKSVTNLRPADGPLTVTFEVAETLFGEATATIVARSGAELRGPDLWLDTWSFAAGATYLLALDGTGRALWVEPSTEPLVEALRSALR